MSGPDAPRRTSPAHSVIGFYELLVGLARMVPGAGVEPAPQQNANRPMARGIIADRAELISRAANRRRRPLGALIGRIL